MPFPAITAVFSLLHDKNFETNEKNFNRIDESITPHSFARWFVEASMFVDVRSVGTYA